MSLDLSPTPLARSNHAAGKVYLALFEAGVLDTCGIFVNLHNVKENHGARVSIP